SLALALAMLLRRNRTRLWTAFAFLNLSLFLYQLGDFLLGVLAYKAVWPYRLTLAAAGFIPAAVLEFLVAFQGDSGGRAVALRRLAVSCSALMVAIALSPLERLPWVRVSAASVIFLLLTAAIYGLLVRWTGGQSTGLFLFNTLVASFVILILFEPLKAKVEERVLAFFFAERFQLVQAMQALRQRVASVVDVRQLGQVVLDA